MAQGRRRHGDRGRADRPAAQQDGLGRGPRRPLSLTSSIPAEALIEAAQRFGTPVNVTDLAVLQQCAEEVKRAFPDPWIRQFSVKANDVPAIIREVAACGFGANVVSRGEWALAAEARIANECITLEGIGKTDDDLAAAVQASARGASLLWISVESAEEAAALTGFAKSAKLRDPLEVLLRVNPQVQPETINGLAVGTRWSKFGILADEIDQVIEAGGGDRGALRWRGLHLHVGSQLRAIAAWEEAVRGTLAVFARWRSRLPDFDTLDLGGGFPTGLEEAPPPAVFGQAFAGAMATVPADRRPQRLAIEPGRFLTASAGYLLARVLHAREGRGADGEPLVVIDAGMTELIRPALYGARHPVVALTSGGESIGAPIGSPRATVIEGPICESTDRLGTHPLPPLRRGDLLAILETGAYASSMSSRYNGRPRPAEVLLEPDGRLRLARPRGHAGIWQQS